MGFNGSVFGYDPGGNRSHGAALIRYENRQVAGLNVNTFTTAEKVIRYVETTTDIKDVGIDTLTMWSSGESGWRPADRWLKEKYKTITHSVASPNSLFCSMGLNGMSVLSAMRCQNPSLPITEAHPKVLYFALSGLKYDYACRSNQMDEWLSELLQYPVKTSNDHEWDAVISAYAAFMGRIGVWKTDLHRLPTSQSERLIRVCGDTNYWWPDA